MIVLVMGVSGCGKTTVGRLVAEHLGCEFADADDYHSPANVAKMHAGIPLTDADRLPWLDALRSLMVAHLDADKSLVLACSALKNEYRQRLTSGDARVKVVYLKGDYNLIAARLGARHNHYMNPHLLQSQFDTLEEPTDAITVSIDATPDQIAQRIEQALQP